MCIRDRGTSELARLLAGIDRDTGVLDALDPGNRAALESARPAGALLLPEAYAAIQGLVGALGEVFAAVGATGADVLIWTRHYGGLVDAWAAGSPARACLLYTSRCV